MSIVDALVQNSFYFYSNIAIRKWIWQELDQLWLISMQIIEIGDIIGFDFSNIPYELNSDTTLRTYIYFCIY